MENLSRLLVLLEPTSLLLLGTAVAVVVASAVRALWHELNHSPGKNNEDAAVMLEGSHVLLLPFFSSFSLLIIFYYFHSISLVLTVMCMICATTAIMFTVMPLWETVAVPVEQLLLRALGKAKRQHCDPDRMISKVVLGVLSLLLVFAWLLSGHWLLNNLLSMCLCISFVSLIRLPNVKLCAMLLGVLFLYDIFWVFGSEWIFGTNVMVAAATKQATNPVHSAAKYLNIPVPRGVAKVLDLPVKIQYPRQIFAGGVERYGFMMLGLGDLALPSMLLALVLCHDYKRLNRKPHGGLSGVPWSGGYTFTAIVGYTFGLMLAFLVGALTSSPQPALLYLVPLTLFPVLLQSSSQGEFRDLWSGPRPIFCRSDHKAAEV